MSKMKHLLRKLHIGGGVNAQQQHHHRMPEARPVSVSSNPSTSPSPAASSSDGRIASSAAESDRAGTGDGGSDFSLWEEEYQMQLALAISASDPDGRKDPESAQIDAAKRISLGCPLEPVANAETLVESLSLRYWSYNVVNYDERVMDGFYDVYGIASNSIIQGKMPLLVDLQAISISDNVDYEVILVNRFMDPELRELEQRAHIVSLETQVSNRLVLKNLIQKIADIVVERMGGPVGDAEEMASRWRRRSKELRNALNSIIIPLGRLDVGLSRHRALLFKVLADRINLPCLLVKGSYYTGTDDGAVNLIKVDDGSEYIIDLMGAPGTLIPPEVPSTHLTNPVFDTRGFAGLFETPKLALFSGEGSGTLAVSPNLVPQVGSSVLEEALFVGIKADAGDVNVAEKSQTERFEHEFGELFQSSHKSYDTSPATRKPSSAQNMKANNVSKYVINAAKNPDFASKLHAVLLESDRSPPPNLFPDVNQSQKKVLEQVLENRANLDNVLHCHTDVLSVHGQALVPLTGNGCSNKFRCDDELEQSIKELAEQQRGLETKIPKSEVSCTSNGFLLVGDRVHEKLHSPAVCVDMTADIAPGMLGSAMLEKPIHLSSLPSAMDSSHPQPENILHDDSQCFQEKRGKVVDIELEKESDAKLIEMALSGLRAANSGYCEKIHPVLGEVAEWEIPWEDLQIGERIGIGSYGEVYHGDWNGTEVAVKKFLDQDFSGDALVQFRCEAEIMLRLRHPNVVLFMGAVTRPPNLSILTEYLPRGSLYRLLHRPNSCIEGKRRMRMALDVAKGMNYLHTSHPTIVHRDLKSPNLLVDKNWVVKVCDFGLSRMKHNTFLSSKSTAGTPEWMAPEVLRNEPANEKCDVYSFGVILWELVTCQIPWKGLNPMQVVGAVGFQNRRLEIPEGTDPAIAQIIHDCWQLEPCLRPSFAQLISRLRRVQHLLGDGQDHTVQTTD
ncbi:hypothetical protein Tsubulata_037847 [Turnera subulata]|uniref:non-specific serine/threonine protein kinase n=1 Tax=Turnera subulata TaxID=218843 RepID=A0A9Q0FUA3_9ROSI|nr:hypothetical protein Tsubulata_037847 [Turnera subulata]